MFVCVVMTLAQTAFENHGQVRSGPYRVSHRTVGDANTSDLNPRLSACISAQIAIQTWRSGVIVPDDWKFELQSLRSFVAKDCTRHIPQNLENYI